MVCGAIRFGWRSNLLIMNGTLTSQRYIDEILATKVVPFFQNHRTDIFMRDSPHVARASLAYLQANNVSLLDWPASSPDMNPIEHFWDNLDRQVRTRTPPPRNLQELLQVLTDGWNQYRQHKINRLVTSMHRRVHALSASRGSHTRY